MGINYLSDWKFPKESGAINDYWEMGRGVTDREARSQLLDFK